MKFKIQFFSTYKQTKLIFLNLLFAALTISCNDDNQNNEPLVGKFTWEEWQAQANWTDYSAADYNLEGETINNLKDTLLAKEIKFILFGSSWCSDCKLQMPRIMKILSAAAYDVNKIEIYGLDYQKQEPTGIWYEYDVKWVPTLIILEDNIEKGRIVEAPGQTLEQDIFDCVK